MPKIDYVVRETTSNLARNFTLTLASIMTVVVSLSLVGASLMLRQGVRERHQALAGRHRVRGLHERRRHPGADRRGRQGPRRQPRGREHRPTSTSRQSYEEFKKLFADSAGDGRQRRRPRSCRRRSGSCPVDKDAEVVEALGEQYSEQAGGARGRLRRRPPSGRCSELSAALHRRHLRHRRRSCSAPPSCWSSTPSAWPCSPAGARSR